MVDQATIDAALQPLEDVRTDAGLCHWTDVATAIGQARRVLADSPNSLLGEPTLADLDDAKHQLAAVALRKAADQIERFRRALVNIAHTETEESHGNSKDMPSGYYRELARAALATKEASDA